MPTAVTLTLAELRDLIKKEARVSGSDNLDDWIDALVNEIICDYAQKSRYFELLRTNVVVTTTLNNGTYPLPADFIAFRLVRYKETPRGYIRTLNPRPQFIDTALGRRPRWYDVAGSNFVLFESDDIPAGDTLLLDYYAYPQMIEDADVFPIPRIFAPTKIEAIRRTLIYNQQLQEAQILKGEAVEIETRGRRP